MSDRFRAAGVTTVIGGLHVTAVPDEALAHCDIVVAGEGEPVWRRLLADVESGTAEQVYRPDAPFDLSDAPIPRYDLLDPAKYNRLTVQTQRGCPWRCEFCASSILLTPRYETKPADKVAAEIKAMKSIWPDPFVELSDDNSFVNRHHARDLVAAIGIGERPVVHRDRCIDCGRSGPPRHDARRRMPRGARRFRESELRRP